MLNKYEHNLGTGHAHNFENTFLDSDALKKPSKKVGESIADFTQQKINQVLGVKTKISQKSIGSQIDQAGGAQFFRYTPNQQSLMHNSGASQRIIRMQEVQTDPLNPAQFKHKRIAGGPPSPPTTVLRSPPKQVSQKERMDWKIPVCISNWKNSRGHAIPLDIRVSADGRTLQQHSVNEKFAKFADTLYITERQARTEIEERNKVQQSIAYKDYLNREQSMREKAKKVKEEQERLLQSHMDVSSRTDQISEDGSHDPYASFTKTENQKEMSEDEARALKQRELMRYVIKREQERELRMKRAGIANTKFVRDQERDISERIALGQAQPSANMDNSLLDQRIINQVSGLDSGYREDDENNAFDQPLFSSRKVADLYGGLGKIKADLEDDEHQPEIERILRKQPHRGFAGADESQGSRTRPVEFEKAEEGIKIQNFKDEEEESANGYFGMSGFLSQKKLKK